MVDMLSTPHVLLVEDSALTRRIFKTALEPEGFHILEAASAEAALDEVERVQPDIVLIDFVLDGILDGADLAVELKEKASFAAVPLVAITSVQVAEMREKIQNAPFDMVLSKPVSVSALVSTVVELLERSRIAS